MIFKKLRDDAIIPPLPYYEYDAGRDLFLPEDVSVPAFSSIVVGFGIYMPAFPAPVGGLVPFVLLTPRSHFTVKHNILPVTGVIDCGYTGEIKVTLLNPTNEAIELNKVDSPCQAVLQYGEKSVSQTGEPRNENSFGSSSH